MRLVKFSAARRNLKAVIDQIIDDADYTVITRRKGPDVVLMSLDTYNRLMQAVHPMNSPAGGESVK